MKKVGFIGCGNMGRAILSGLMTSRKFEAKDVIASAKSKSTLDKLATEFGIETTEKNTLAAKEAEIIFLAVKPNLYREVIDEIKDCVRESQIVVSIAPGFLLEDIQNLFGKPVKTVRAMPNTPAQVGEGMTAVCASSNVTREELDEVKELFHCCGRTEETAEKLMDVVVSVSGSSPAYFFMMLEAMADGAVADGMPRQQAYTFAAQAMLGSAKMYLETGRHPGELKDMVCSPGGTTIEAVRKLEAGGFRSSIIEAMKSCVETAKKMR